MSLSFIRGWLVAVPATTADAPAPPTDDSPASDEVTK